MPCYLFTYHAYGTWLPDRKKGYVKRKQGVLPQDQQLAVQYRKRMVGSVKGFDEQLQLSIISSVLDSRDKQYFETYFIATDSSHTHLLVAWRDDRTVLHMRSSIKSSISRSLNKKYETKKWLSEGGSRKQVSDQEHFDYLMNTYLPRHRGWKWSLDEGFFR